MKNQLPTSAAPCPALPRRRMMRFTAWAALGLPLLATPALAATFAWDGGGATNSFWAQAGNWNTDVTPTFNNEADIIFSGAARTLNQLSGNRTVRSITFDENAAAFNVSTRASAATTAGAANLTFAASAGNATLTVVGPVAGGGPGAGTATIDGRTVTGAGASGNIILTSNLDVIHNGLNTLSLGNNVSQITGPGALSKSGPGVLILAGNNTYEGRTTVADGTLRLSGIGGTNTKFSTTAPMTLGSETGTATFSLDAIITLSLDQTAGSLTLAGNAGFNFGTLASGNTFRYAPSNGLFTAGKTLSLFNWSEGLDHLYFGTDSTALDPAQLGQISFYSGPDTSTPLGTAKFGTSGEIVPIPEPAATLLAALGAATAFRRRRDPS